MQNSYNLQIGSLEDTTLPEAIRIKRITGDTKSNLENLSGAPPAAARKARIKRQNSLHVVIIPRLMKPLWLKHLFKTADVIFQIMPNTSHWSHFQFEPLTIALCFPFLPFHP